MLIGVNVGSRCWSCDNIVHRTVYFGPVSPNISVEYHCKDCAVMWRVVAVQDMPCICGASHNGLPPLTPDEQLEAEAYAYVDTVVGDPVGTLLHSAPETMQREH